MRNIFFLSCLFLFALTTRAQSSLLLSYSLASKVEYGANAFYFFSGPRFTKCSYDGQVIWTKSVPSWYTWDISEDAIYILKTTGKLLKLDTLGNVIWARDLSALNWIYDLVVNHDKLYFYCRYSCSRILVLDSAGTYINTWNDYSGNANVAGGVYPRGKAGVWISEIIGPGNGSYTELVQTNEDGEIDTLLNGIFYNQSYDDNIADVLIYPDSNCLIINNGSDPFGGIWNNCGLTKVDQDGNILWQKTFQSNSDTVFQVSKAGLDEFGNCYLVMYVQTDFGGLYFIKLKLDSSGNVLFCNKLTFTNPNLGFPIAYAPLGYHNNHMYCAGGIGNYFALIVFDSLMKFCGITDSAMTISEIGYFPTTSNWYAWSTMQDTILPDTGSANPYAQPSVWDLCGYIDHVPENIKADVSIYPNPFHEGISIQGSNLKDGSLTISDITNKTVYQSMNYTGGKIDLTFLNNGVYFIFIQTNNCSICRKIVKI